LKYLLLAFLCVLGCEDAITNEKIIQEKNKCEAAGMCYELQRSGATNRLVLVECVPCKGEKH